MERISEKIRLFLAANIASVPHLELLVLLWRDQRYFSAAELGRRLYLGPQVVISLAMDLVEAGLLERDAGDERFRVRVPSGELRELLGELDRTYSRQVRRVTELVHANARSQLQSAK